MTSFLLDFGLSLEIALVLSLFVFFARPLETPVCATFRFGTMGGSMVFGVCNLLLFFINLCARSLSLDGPDPGVIFDGLGGHGL